jgi:ADP-ribosyl-[dinitrogen reductase] hydrolase
LVRNRPLKAPVKSLLEGKQRREPDGSIDALTATRTAIAAFASTSNASEALLLAAATPASSVTAALCGALAGAHYGIDSIQYDWRAQLGEDQLLRSLARQLLT